MNETVTIKLKEYSKLLTERAELYALYAGGVDNWEGYSESLRDAGLLDDEEDDE